MSNAERVRERPVKLYVVLCNGRPGVWQSRLFEDTIAGALAYQTRKDADNAASKARVMYGWAKVIRCEAGR